MENEQTEEIFEGVKRRVYTTGGRVLFHYENNTDD